MKVLDLIFDRLCKRLKYFESIFLIFFDQSFMTLEISMEKPFEDEPLGASQEQRFELSPQSRGDQPKESVSSSPELSKSHQNSPEQSTAPKRSQSAGEPWRKAVKRLYKAIVSISEDKGDFSNPEDALSALLEEVASNENITEGELLGNLRNRNLDSSPTHAVDKPISPKTDDTRDDGKISPQQKSTVDSSDEYSDAEEGGTSEQHEFLKRLTNMDKLLMEEGSDAVKDVDSVLFRRRNVSGKFQLAVEYAVKKLQEQWDVILNVLMPQQQLQTLIFISVINVISVQRIFNFLPLVVCYVSFLVMVYSTLGMFGSRSWIKRVDNWRRLLAVFQPSKKHGVVLDDADGGSYYSWKSTEPYITFFISLALFVFSLSLIGDGGSGVITLPNRWSMCSISVFFVVLCFVALADRHDSLAVLVMALDVFSSAPAIMNKFGFRSNEIPLIGFLVSNWEACQFGLVHIQIGLPSLAVIITLIIYCGMILVYPRREILTVIVPHVVCIAWWHTSLELFLIDDGHLFTMFGWLDVALTLGVIWFIMFPTVASMVVVVAIILAQARHIFDSASLLKTGLTATILLLPFAYRKLRDLAQKRSWSDGATSTGKIHVKRTVLALIIYGLLVFTAAAVLYEARISNDGREGKLAKGLTWTHYEQHCLYADENLENRLRQQIACSQLQGTSVKWRGTIQGVRIVKIDNIFETVLSYLPKELAWRLRCVYGETQNESSTAGTVLHGLDAYECTLVKHNVYTFEIDASGPFGQQTFSSAKGTVVLVASSSFQELVTEFEQGDVVEFTASFLAESLLKYPPKLKLIQLQCLACQHVTSDQHIARFVVSYGDSIWTKLFNACCFLFNFIFSPLFLIS